VASLSYLVAMARPLEPGDRPLDPIALAVTHRIDQGRPATSWSTSGSGLLLVGPLGDGVRGIRRRRNSLRQVV
jgi:hypothetical protein